MVTRKGFLKGFAAFLGLGSVAASTPVSLTGNEGSTPSQATKPPKTATEAMYEADRETSPTAIIDFSYCQTYDYPIPDFKPGDSVYLDHYFMGIARRWVKSKNGSHMGLEVWKYRQPIGMWENGVAHFGWLWRPSCTYHGTHLQPSKGTYRGEWR